MMTFYTLLQRQVVLSKAPIHTNEKYLLTKIHQHFPVTKVLSSPARQAWKQPCLGFQRPTTALGLGRTFGAARQYSTSPFAPVFQHSAPTNSVFAHISSRSFKPTATKLNQVDMEERQPAKPATPTEARKVSRNDTNEHLGAKVFVPEPILTPMTITETNNLRSNIIHHDELSSLHQELLHQEQKPCVHKKTARSFSPIARSVFILIPMDVSQFWTSKKQQWSTEQLSSSFVDSIEQMAYEYQIHIDSVLKLLDRLERHGEFRTVTGRNEIRIYFPQSVQSKQEAMLVLDAFHVMNERHPFFSIQVEDCELEAEENDFNLDNDFIFIERQPFFSVKARAKCRSNYE
jgi:hypothetical protein